jgi:SAM-dependent methyltransferase
MKHTPGDSRSWLTTASCAGRAFLPRPLKSALKGAIHNHILLRSEFVRDAWNLLWTEVRIAATVRRSAARFRALQGRRGLKVHLGCGDDLRAGWVNIDLDPRPGALPPGASAAGTVYIAHDLRRGLPLEDGSCDLVYSSHLLEHLDPRHGLYLMRECHRALRPGGVFRAALPDFRGLFDAYLRGDAGYLDLVDIRKALPYLEPGTESLVDYVNNGVYQNGEHRCIYDEDKLLRILRRIGFASAEAVAYQDGLDPPGPLRRRYSFYVSACR